ncbi:MAG: cysteine hydrolase [Candidatus Diapherotrites archaeon]|nr:cysteine hydrolase [Candidatus Diapherotrites archaeon]
MKPALLVMDFENDIVHEKGKIGAQGYAQFLKEHGTFERVQSLIRKAREKDVPIVFVMVGFSKDYREWSPVPRAFQGAKEAGLVTLGTWGTEFHEKIDVQAKDFVVVKHRISPFYGTDLEVILRTLGIDTLYLAGVSTNYVVQSMAREAHDRDFHVVIVADCCGASNVEEHEHALATLQHLAMMKKEVQVAFTPGDLESK